MTALRTEDEGPRGFVPRRELYAAQRRIEALEAELEHSRDTIGRILGQDALLGIIKLGFAKCEAALIAAMLARPLQPTAALIAAYQYDRSNQDADIDNLVKVRVCMIRKKARRFGCPGDPIRTLWGSGYALSDAGRDWLLRPWKIKRPSAGNLTRLRGYRNEHQTPTPSPRPGPSRARRALQRHRQAPAPPRLVRRSAEA